MPLMLRASRLTAITVLYATAAAADVPEPSPSVYLQAFNDTCRGSFPDFDAIAKAAVARGWIERAVPSVAMIGNRPMMLPMCSARVVWCWSSLTTPPVLSPPFVR